MHVQHFFVLQHSMAVLLRTAAAAQDSRIVKGYDVAAHYQL
jgi:hypothetical protein